MGSFTVELYYKHAPKTVKNFVKLAEKGYYDGTIVSTQLQRCCCHSGTPSIRLQLHGQLAPVLCALQTGMATYRHWLAPGGTHRSAAAAALSLQLVQQTPAVITVGTAAHKASPPVTLGILCSVLTAGHCVLLLHSSTASSVTS
jgi:hypothetical protein